MQGVPGTLEHRPPSGGCGTPLLARIGPERPPKEPARAPTGRSTFRPPMLEALSLPDRYGEDWTLLGSGGFGTVYKVYDRVAHRFVALKVPYGGNRTDRVHQVPAEVRAAARLDHPGIVAVLDAGITHPTHPWFATEFCDGGSLSAWMASGPRPWAETLPLLEQVLTALGFAHARGLIHRDLNPDNVLLEQRPAGPVARLADFGLAKHKGTTDEYGSTRLGVGTILYMPPEAFEDDVASIHSGADLYAFGVILYLLAGGEAPWERRDLALLLETSRGPTRPLRLRERVGAQPSLAEVTNRLLDPDPDRRYAFAEHVRRDLRTPPSTVRPSVRFTGGDPGATGSQPVADDPLPRPSPPSRRALPVAPAVARFREPSMVGALSRRDEARATLSDLLERPGVEETPHIEVGALRELGNLAILTGDAAEAHRFLRRALASAEGAGLRAEGAATRNSLGELARGRGDLAEARREYAAALSVVRAYGIRSEGVVILLNLVMTELSLGGVPAAARHLQEAEGWMESTSPLRPYAEVLQLALQTARADWSAAEDTFERISARGNALPADADLVAWLETAA